MTDQKKLSIIVPVYNEKKTLPVLLERIERVVLPLEKEIIIVDDCSLDGTRDWLKSVQDKYQIIFKKRNSGKGSSLKIGIERATGESIIFQDADLEYDPEDYPAMIRPILDGKTEVVLGIRETGDHSNYKWKSPYHFVSGFGNKLITWATNLLYWNNAREYEGCYKVFTKKALDQIVCKLLKKGYKTIDVPIRYYPRSYKEGKHIKWSDGFKILWAIVKWRVRD